MASAARTFEADDVYCKKCKSKVVSYVKCVSCDSCYHPSCAKQLKYQVVDKLLVKCCDKSDDAEWTDSSDIGFFDAIENLASSADNKVDMHIFKYVIKQKDLLIFELRDKIKLLNDQLYSLKSKSEQKPSIKPDDANDKNLNVKNATSSGLSSTIVREINGKNKISAQDVRKAIKNAETYMKDNDVLATSCDTANTIQKVENDNIETWKKVTHKRVKKPEKKLIVGKFGGPSTVEGVDRTSALHVFNLKPNTTASDLQSFLCSSFPEVVCTPLNSRYPDRYSSFKVLISRTNYDKAMDASLWPNKACVRDFFERRTSRQQNT